MGPHFYLYAFNTQAVPAIKPSRAAGKFLSLFLNWAIMSNAIQSIAGTIHKGHERFSDISRGRQSSFMTFSTLLCAQSCLVRHWDTATVDQTLVEGDRMYLNALESRNIPDTETLSLIYLPIQACWKVQSPTEVTKSPEEANCSTQSPFEANNLRQSPVEANVSTQSHTIHDSFFKVAQNEGIVNSCINLSFRTAVKLQCSILNWFPPKDD